MPFNSIQFAIFFSAVFGLYLLFRDRYKLQNRMLLLAGCIFYGAWDWRFLILLFTSVTTDFICSNKIHATGDTAVRRRWLLASLVVNLSILGFFKYFNFFIGTMQMLLERLGVETGCGNVLLHVFLPVAISFYTFQTISYTIDVYRRETVPAEDYLDFALYLTFFPVLLAGPIMRARELLLQIQSPRTVTLDRFYEGAYLIFLGLFQKIFVADNLAGIADPVFASPGAHDSGAVLVAVYAFTFQIYFDFAGYSNIARGLGRCMGFEIMYNFNLPYFSANPSEFWRRWHISLSSWLRDYLYIPLGGRRGGTLKTCRNLMVTMLLGGLWHGANWTFVAWGAYHGLLLVLHRSVSPFFRLFRRDRGYIRRNISRIVRVAFCFHLVCAGWIFFRAGSISQAIEMLGAIVFNSGTASLDAIKTNLPGLLSCICIPLAVDALAYAKGDLMAVYKLPSWLKGAVYLAMLVLMITKGIQGGKEFIYMQF